MIDDSFGHWFAGFAAGEGCFDIRTTKTAFQCRFGMNLRADDIVILRKIQKELGHGKIYRVKNRKNSPNTKFEVDTKEGCIALCHLFSKYPLHAKKADDFKVWKKAVHEWNNIEHGDRWNPDKNKTSWERIGGFQKQLKETRLYKEIA